MDDVVFHGRDTGRPVLLVITGAFAKADAFAHLQGSLPQVDVWRAPLPGNHSPALSETSISAWAAAFSSALRPLDRPLGVIGLSAGALVALALEHPCLRRLLLVEPPLRPDLAWPLKLMGDQSLAAIFSGQDYSPLLAALAVPATVIIGDKPLLGRAVRGWPSLVDPESRAELAAHPMVTLKVVQGGHDIPRDNPGAFFLGLAEVVLGLRPAGVALQDHQDAPISTNQRQAGPGAAEAALSDAEPGRREGDRER